MNTQHETHNTVSIRASYLKKRAELIRQHLHSRQENIPAFVSQICSEEFNATRDEILFARCLEWMQANLHTSAPIKNLSRELKVSVRKVQRLFTFFINKSYTTFFLEMRIHTAKRYLTEMKNNIGEVGFLVGIKDHAYFTYLFRKSTNQTPTQFRLQIMSSQINQDRNSINLS